MIDVIKKFATALGLSPESVEFLDFAVKGLLEEHKNPPPPIPTVGPLEVTCPFCEASVGSRCLSSSGKKTSTHKGRYSRAGYKAITDSGRCLNLMCSGGKVFDFNTGTSSDCISCNGTGTMDTSFWDKLKAGP